MPDVCVIELGGTVGDIESMPFVEALRQFHFRCAADRSYTVLPAACTLCNFSATAEAGAKVRRARRRPLLKRAVLPAARARRVGADNMCIVHVSLVPIIGVVGEQKTKPTQHSVAVLRSLGLHPNLLACRCSEPLDEGVRSKLVRAVFFLHAVVCFGALKCAC